MPRTPPQWSRQLHAGGPKHLAGGKFYEIFVAAGFGGKCAIVTSYIPNASDIAKEDSGEGATEKLRQYEIYRQMLSDYFNEPADKPVLRIVFDKLFC